MENFEIREDREIYSLKYRDLYWSREGAIAEKSFIFLESGGLPERWKYASSFQILELGFGAGINFLVTLDAWKRSGTDGRLVYISLEESPLPVQTLKNLYNHLDIPGELYGDFLDSYTRLERGFQNFCFESLNLELVLGVGNALESLKKMDTAVDSIFLDGFSPQKNPEMWSPEIFKELYRLAARNAIFTTYSGAAMVRENATLAGFGVEKLKGFGTKKWMLKGTKQTLINSRNPEPYYSVSQLHTYRHSDLIVLGGGLAGTSIASAMARRNFRVHLIEREDGLARKTSGNPAGIVNPNLTAGHTVLSTLELNAYFHLHRFLDAFPFAKKPGFERTGILSFEDEEPFQKKLSIHSADSLYEEYYDKNLEKKGFLLKDGMWISPSDLCTTNINNIRDRSKIQISFNSNLLEINRKGKIWHIRDSSGREFETEILILANSYDITHFSQTRWLPIRKFRGQLIYIPKKLLPLELNFIYNLEDCYVIPYKDFYIVGATYQKDNENENMDTHDSKILWERFTKYFRSTIQYPPDKLLGRAGIRATTPDHLPIVGPIPDTEFFQSEYANLQKGGKAIGLPDAKYLDGLYAFSGFGSKGILLTNFLAESLSRMILGEFTGLEKEVVHAIQPSRFLVRNLMKRKGYEEILR